MHSWSPSLNTVARFGVLSQTTGLLYRGPLLINLSFKRFRDYRQGGNIPIVILIVSSGGPRGGAGGPGPPLVLDQICLEAAPSSYCCLLSCPQARFEIVQLLMLNKGRSMLLFNPSYNLLNVIDWIEPNFVSWTIFIKVQLVEWEISTCLKIMAWHTVPFNICSSLKRELRPLFVNIRKLCQYVA